ncbi:MAG: hypothetical protein CR993_03750 [Rhodobacterales bacterium]|nr:MAG: hypothetical protein CR993_03750 [Rhodobacterales bacterium]
MKKHFSVSLFAALCAAPAAADGILSAEEFEALTLNKTYLYANEDGVYGDETYLPNRRAIWSFGDGNCMSESWFERGEFLCFLLDDRQAGEETCVLVREEEGGVLKVFSPDFAGDGVLTAIESDEPQNCTTTPETPSAPKPAPEGGGRSNGSRLGAPNSGKG